MKMSALIAVVFLTSFLGITHKADANIIGIYHYLPGDKISVQIKNGRPIIKIETDEFPDLPQCSGFQTYRTIPFFGRDPLELRNVEPHRRSFFERQGISASKVVGFSLWESRQCLEAIWAYPNNKIPIKRFIYELDVFEEFFAYFTNKEDLIRGFESGEFFLALQIQVNVGHGFNLRQAYYTYKDAVSGKILFGN